MGLDMIARTTGVRGPDGAPLALRVGISSGSAVAGVIGRQKFAYDLRGDTVNTAGRMESHGVAGFVHVDDATRALVGDRFPFTDRGLVAVKGKGTMRTWLAGITG
jgi:class 3 adenylate cyclase